MSAFFGFSLLRSMFQVQRNEVCMQQSSWSDLPKVCPSRKCNVLENINFYINDTWLHNVIWLFISYEFDAYV